MKLPVLPPWLNLNTLSAAIIVGLAIYIGIQKIELLTCRLHSKDMQRQLQVLSDKSKEKQIEVREVIKQGKDRIITVQKEVEKIEAAPLEGDCKTPKAVLEADV